MRDGGVHELFEVAHRVNIGMRPMRVDLQMQPGGFMFTVVGDGDDTLLELLNVLQLAVSGVYGPLSDESINKACEHIAMAKEEGTR